MNENKAALRAAYLRLRRVWTDAQRDELHRRITETVLHLPAFQDAAAILCYASREDEVCTWGILQSAWQQGKKVALPRCETGGRMAFYRVTGVSQLQKGMLGILEPKNDCPLYTPCVRDLCIVPGVAFDRRGNRLGYGGGYYDRYLVDHPMQTVGLCYPNCRAEYLPVDPFDIPVQQVICCHLS